MTKLEIVDGFPEGFSGTYVDWDEYKTGIDGTLLWTPGLGPCLAVTVYSAQLGKGALAHLTQGQRDEISPCMYHRNVVDTLASAITENYAELEATLAGESQGEIGISAMIRKRLGELKIPIVGEDTGIVPIGREVHLNCATGKVTVYRYQ